MVFPRRLPAYRQPQRERGHVHNGSCRDLDLSKASFWNSWDAVTNVITGTFRGHETAVFHFHANHGEMGYKQTTVAIKSDAPIVGMSSFWQGSGILAERIGEWIVMFRPRDTVAPPRIRGFLDDCVHLVQYFEDRQRQQSEQGSRGNAGYG